MNEKNPVNSPRVKPGSLTPALATKLIMIVGSHSALQLSTTFTTASDLTVAGIVLIDYVVRGRIYFRKSNTSLLLILLK